MIEVRETRTPRAAGDVGANGVAELVTDACLYIEQHVDEQVTLDRIGRAVGASPFHLQRVFKERTGVSPREYREALRVRALKELLREDVGTTRAVFEAGYGSVGAAYAASDAHLAMTPATYGKGGRGARIRFATVGCRFGEMLVGQTDRGVCAVTLGGSRDELERALRREYPQAEITASDRDLRVTCRQLAEWASRPATTLDLPLDVRATAFQWRVWRALRAIPRGRTFTYAEVAAAIDRPSAVRAVAGACARNPVALVVPCHRVVRADGTPGGYRWGVDRKQAILAAEAAIG